MDQFQYLPSMPPSPPFPSSSFSSLFISPSQLAEDHGDPWTSEENKSFEDAFAKFDLVPPTPAFPSSSSSTLSISQPQLVEDHGEQWTFEENKRFENALAEFGLGAPDLCENIHSRVPGKTLSQIKKHLDDLFEDIDNIEKGIIPIPDYKSTPTQVKSNPKSKARKKGVTWTEEEHK